MISNIPFNSFKNSPWVKKHRKAVLIIIFLILGSAFIYETIMVGAVVGIYVFGTLLHFFLIKGGRFEDVVHWTHEG